MFDYLVIGKGLFGSSAARYLSRKNASVAVVGPDEPLDWTAHKGAFASHYDQGRLSGFLGRGAVWSKLAFLSIKQYGHIETTSGIRFHTPVGRLHMPASRVASERLETAVNDFGVAVQQLTTAELHTLYPYLHFEHAAEGILENAPAGYINPRALIKAQLQLAKAAGARIVPEMATTVTTKGDHLQVTIADGRTIMAKKVLIAAGAFSNCFELLPRKLDLRVKSETILLAEVPESEAARLAKMPAVDCSILSPVLDDIYLLPPLRYPDGRYYAKMGCNTTADQFFDTYEEMRAWFISGDSDRVLGEMTAAFRSLLPDLQVDSFATKRCIVTYTPHGLPIIDALLPGQIFVAVGGNGSGAKSADAIGRLAADLMMHGELAEGFERAWFQA